MALIALLALITGVAGVLLLQRQRAEEQLASDVDATIVQYWQAAQAALMAGDDQRTLALVTDLRRAAPDFEPTAVKSLHIAACTNLARAAESTCDIPTAQAQWACVLEEDPDVTAGSEGSQNAQAYLDGQAASAKQDFAGAIAAWEPLHAIRPNYADLKPKLYDTYLAYGDALCAQQDVQGGQTQFVAAQNIDPGRTETAAHQAACQPPTAPTSTPLAGPHLAVVANTSALRVRAGPGLDYPVLDRLENNTTVTILGRTEDTLWVHVQAGQAREGWVSAEYLIPTYPLSAAPVEPVPSPTP